jgi:DNA-directed RNA polymerase beta subunit
MHTALHAEVSGPDEDLLCRKVWDTKIAFEYIVESFDLFMKEGIQECFSSRPLSIPGTDNDYAIIKVMNDLIKKPHYTNDYEQDTDATPAICMLEKRSYAVDIPVQVQIVRSNGTSAVSKMDKSGIENLFSILIMKYSEHCWDHEDDDNKINDQTSRSRHSKKDEIDNPTDPGCIFIVDGNVKFMPLYEKVRQNQFIVGTSPDTGLPFTYQLSETPFSTSNTACRYYIDPQTKNKLVGITLNKSEFSVYKDTTGEGGDEKESDDYSAVSSIKNKKPKTPVNALEVIYALMFCKLSTKASMSKNAGLDKGMVMKTVDDLLSKVIPSEVYMDCRAKFQYTTNSFMSRKHDNIIRNVVVSLEIVAKDEKTVTKPDANDMYTTKRRMESYFKTKMLPNILNFDDKVNTIIMLISYLLQRIVDPLEKDTDRDHWGHKGLSRARELLTDSLSKKLTKFFEFVEKNSDFKTGISADDLLKIITNPGLGYSITDELIRDFKPPVQGSFTFKKTGKVTEPIAMDIMPNNANDLRNVLGKTRTAVNKNTPSFAPRSAHPSSYPGICPVKVTENELVGITKFMAQLSTISNKGDPREVASALLTRFYPSPDKKGVDYILIVTKEYQPNKRTVPVLVNGMLIGFANINTGYKNITLFKRYGIIDRQCCVVKTRKGTIEVYCDSRRLLVPVVGCDDDGILRIHSTTEDWKSMTYDQLIERGYIEFFDSYEMENPNVILAETFASFANYKIELNRFKTILDDAKSKMNQEKDVEIKQRYATIVVNTESELESLKKGKYSHAALHPNGAYSFGAANIPFGNHQMACRSAYASKHDEQKMNRDMGDRFAHTNGFLSAYNTKTLIESSTANLTKTNELVAGQTIVIGFLPWYENQEDACIVSQAAVDKGFRFQTITIIKESLEIGEQFGRFNKDKDPYKQRNILENGLPIVNAYYGEGDCVLGKYSQLPLAAPQAGKFITSDKSYYLSKDEVGVVTEVVTYKSKQVKSRGDLTTVSIRLCKYNTLERGGKVASRNAQKHIAAKVVPTVDMPFNERKQSIDMIMSPLCFPTRMTFGTSAEPFYGRAAGITGEVFDVASHKEHNFNRLKKILTRYGYSDTGAQRYYNGITGEKYVLDTFTGPCNVAMLVHVAIKKAQARAGLGKKDNLTNQAVATKYGKCEDKGQKFGEPERNKSLQYGASFLISDRMNTSCDGVQMVVCKQCSSWVNYNPALGKFECTRCDQSELGVSANERFGKYIMPQTALFLQAGLLSIGIDTVYKFVSKEEYLADQ